MDEDYKPIENVLKDFRSARGESFKGREDLAEVGGTPKAVKTGYEVVDLLRGQSRRRWIREFGDL